MIPKAPFLSNILWFSVKYLLIQANALDWEPQSKRDQQSPWSPSPMMGFGGSAEFESRTSVITQKSFGLAGSPGLKHFSLSKRITVPSNLLRVKNSHPTSLAQWHYQPLTMPEFLLVLRWSRVISMAPNSSAKLKVSSSRALSPQPALSVFPNDPKL